MYNDAWITPDGATINGQTLNLCDEYNWYFDEMIETCNNCGRFFLQSPAEDDFSHDVPIIFTDGARFDDGNPNARAGCGVAMGESSDDQFWFYFTRNPNNRRTNQVAELRGIKEGLLKAVQMLEEEPISECWDKEPNKAFLIATDSKYAVDAITQWLPRWKASANGYINASGRPVGNGSEFRLLDELISDFEDRGYLIGLFYVPREYNTDADRLAREGASRDKGPIYKC
ncbi:ribonuclease H-like domain-containing protein [Phyllosticta capitalensis]